MCTSYTGHGSTTTNNGMHFGERSANVFMGFYTNDLSSPVGNALSSVRWTHIVWSYDGNSRKRIYINGVKVADATQAKCK